MQHYFEKQFELRYFEMNKFGEASPTTILTLLEETAAEHCYSIGYSLYDLIEQNIGWVLVSGVFKMYRYPKYKEKITIRTWLSRYTTIRGIRENHIYDEQGNIIGSAKGLWLFFDIARRRPTAIFDGIREKWAMWSEESLIYDISKKIPPVDTAKYIKNFNINRFDTDTNEHVNNIRYLQWVIESIPDEIIDNNFLYSIDGRFIAEAKLGDHLISFAEPNFDESSFQHTIKSSKTNDIFATAKTFWQKR